MERRPSAPCTSLPPAGLLLELEDVVVDTRSARRDALCDALQRIGVELPADAIAACADRHVAAEAAERAVGMALSRGELSRRPDATDTELVALHAERTFETLVGRGVTLVPDARAALTALASRLRLGIVTRASPRVAHQLLTIAGLDALFACVATAGPFSAPPTPDAYRCARRRVALAQAPCARAVLALSDSASALESARLAGLATVIVGAGASDAAAVGHVATIGTLTYDAVVQFIVGS